VATAYKILGQARPLNTSNADLITVSAGDAEVISTITVCNTTASAATYRVFARITGASAAEGNALAYDVAIAANDTVALTLGCTLAATDVLTVRSSVASALTFTAFGSEIDV
jgi:hypothetical protein